MVEKRVDKSHIIGRGSILAIALSKAEAAEAISCSIRKFDAMVRAGTMPKPKLLVDSVGHPKNVKKVWSVKELDKYFHQLPSEGEEQSGDWALSVSNLGNELMQSWEQAKPELENVKERLKQDWEQSKPEREKVKEKVRDLAKKLTD